MQYLSLCSSCLFLGQNKRNQLALEIVSSERFFFRICETLSLNRAPNVRLYCSISTQRDLSFFRVPNKTKKLKTNSPDHFCYNVVDNQTWTLGFMYFFSFPSRDWTEGNKFVLVLYLFLFLLATPRTRTLRCVTCKMRCGKLMPKASISKKISQHWKIPGYYYKKPSCIHQLEEWKWKLIPARPQGKNLFKKKKNICVQRSVHNVYR